MKRVPRQLLLFALIGLAILATAKVPSPTSERQAPGFYRGYLGAFELTALSDGTASRHLDEILSNPELVREKLKADHQSEPVALSINAYLINTGSHLVLVDTGAGELFGPSSGLLLSNLTAAGYRADKVDIILLTHIHGDHSGGLSIQGKRQFPNATVYVDGRDTAHWLNDEMEAKAPSSSRKTFEQSRATISPYVIAGRLVETRPEVEVIPGITARTASGHTPGHTAYLVQSQGHKLLLWGDTIHAAEIQFDHPEVTVRYDVNAEEAAYSRRQWLEFAARTGVLVGSAHISFPGLGHVRKTTNGYRWMPIMYSAVPTELSPES
jgi:glyoxylase-like metal-dependent hydrolase (beta-lactamase superfamily II)